MGTVTFKTICFDGCRELLNSQPLRLSCARLNTVAKQTKTGCGGGSARQEQKSDRTVCDVRKDEAELGQNQQTLLAAEGPGWLYFSAQSLKLEFRLTTIDSARPS